MDRDSVVSSGNISGNSHQSDFKVPEEPSVPENVPVIDPQPQPEIEIPQPEIPDPSANIPYVLPTESEGRLPSLSS